MVTYRLMSNSMYGKKILLEEKSISKLDRFIYEQFESVFDLSKYFNTSSSKYYITYKNNNKIKIMDLILKDNNKDFSYLLFNLKNKEVNTNAVSFSKIIDNFFNNISVEQLNYLYNNNYIDKSTYYDLLNMHKGNNNSFDYVRDSAQVFSELKKRMKSYLVFRKLYSGLKAYQTKEINNERKVIKTNNEFLDKLYNNGGLDEIYSYYDLDDLVRFDQVNDLNIDGIGKKK